MQKRNTLLSYLLCCGIFAQAQSLNNFNDVRQLGVLLNPAHIGKADAKGELAGHYQAGSNIGTFSASHWASVSYVHYLKFKNKDGLNIGLVAENQGFTESINTMSGGLNVAYIHHFDAKNSLSGGVTTNMVQGYRKIPTIYFYIEEPFNDSGYTVNFSYVSTNLGLVWKNKLSENANLTFGFAANNINAPLVIQTYQYEGYDNTNIRNTPTFPNYSATLNSDFMVSKKIGFAPILMYRTGPYVYYNGLGYGGDLTIGSDIRFKIKNENEIRLGYTAQFKEDRNLSVYRLGYSNSKIGVGISYAYFTYKYSPVNIPALQTNFQYAF